MANPGPASTQTANFIIDSQNAYRLIAYAKNVNLSAAGDTPMQGITPSEVAPAVIITANSNATVPNVAAATLGIFTGPGATGLTVHAVAALTGQTTGTFVYVRPASVLNQGISAGNLFVNVVATVAAVGGVPATADVLLYGYDVQP